MLTIDNCVQHTTGSFTGTTSTITLPAGTEQGNTVVVMLWLAGAATATTPTGFVAETGTPYTFRRSNVPAGESSWSITVSATGLALWCAMEWSGLDLNNPYGGRANTGNNSVNPGMAKEDCVLIAATWSFKTATATPGTISTIDPDVTGGGGTSWQVASTMLDQGTGVLSGTGYTLGVATEFPPYGWLSSTSDLSNPVVSFANSTAGSSFVTWAIVYKAAGSAFTPTIQHILGAQHGTAAGIATGNAGIRYLESASAGVGITTTNPRHDTYAFVCNATTTACNFTSYAVTNTGGVIVGRFSFRLNATPAANLELGGISGLVTFRWVQATGKIGCVTSTGTEQVSTSTVASGAWWSIDFRLDTSGTTWQCEWTLTPDSTLVAETEPTATGPGAATTTFTPRIGWTTATTGNVNFADIVTTSTTGAYPLGNYQVRVVKIDAAQAATCADSAGLGGYGVFTANGTVAAMNLTTAPGFVDELPATIGATADGVAVVSPGSIAAANDPSVQLFFEAITLPTGGMAKGARLCAVGWAASATAATVSLWYGVLGVGNKWAAGTLDSAPIDPNFDNSTTAPAWMCAGAGEIVTGFTFRGVDLTSNSYRYVKYGWSNDATPDIGFHAFYLELAVKISPPLVIQRTPSGTAMVTVQQDANTSGYRALTFAPPSDRGITYSYEFPAGTWSTPTYLAAGASAVTVTLDGLTMTTVPRVNVILDPAP